MVDELLNFVPVDGASFGSARRGLLEASHRLRKSAS